MPKILIVEDEHSIATLLRDTLEDEGYTVLIARNGQEALETLSQTRPALVLTREGARALGLREDVGTLEAGKWADLAIWDVESPAELVYRIGFNPLHARVWRGQE